MRAQICVLAALCQLSCMTTTALARSMGTGNTVFMGEGNLYYRLDEKLELLKAIGAIALDALSLAAMDEDDEDWETWHEDDMDLVPVPLSSGNFGARISHFVGSGLALGGRIMYQINSPNEVIQTIWGVGPELTYYWREDDASIRPFLSVGTSYAQGAVGTRDAEVDVCSGYSLQTRGGFAKWGPGSGLYFQTSYQRTRLRHALGRPFEDHKLGIGVGVTVHLK